MMCSRASRQTICTPETIDTPRRTSPSPPSRGPGTATAFNAENAKSAENGRPRGNGNVKVRDVLGGLGVLGVE